MIKIFMLILITVMLLASCSLSDVNTNGNKGSESKDETIELKQTPTPTETTGKISGTADVNKSSENDPTFYPDFNNIKDIIDLKKEAVLNRLGNKYSKVGAGAENSEEGYSFEQFGMTIVFSNISDMIEIIECNEKVDISGAKLGMSFPEIEKIMGKGETRNLIQIEPNQPKYALFYQFDNFIVWFGSATEDGAATDLQIRRGQFLKSEENNINQYHPIVFVYKNISGDFRSIIFGSSKDGKWYNVEDFKLPTDHSQLENFVTDLSKGDEIYKLYSDSKFITTVSGKKPKLYYLEVSGSHVIDPQIDPMTPDEDYLIGVNCDWDALPGMSKILEPSVKSIDLDNDGEDEKLTITETQDPKSKDIIKNVLVHVQKNNNRILELDFELDDIYTTKYKIFTLDLDGDGKMEIINVSTGHNISIDVFQQKGSEFSEVLSFYLGD